MILFNPHCIYSNIKWLTNSMNCCIEFRRSLKGKLSFLEDVKFAFASHTQVCVTYTSLFQEQFVFWNSLRQRMRKTILSSADCYLLKGMTQEWQSSLQSASSSMNSECASQIKRQIVMTIVITRQCKRVTCELHRRFSNKCPDC